MNNQTRTLWISIGLGVFAMFLIYSYSQEKKAEYDKKYGTMKRVIVASKDILEMQTIDESLIEFVEIPVDFIQPGAISDEKLVLNFVASAPFKKGEQILDTKILSLGANTGLSSQVAPGKRALSVPIDESRGVSKLIQPGDRIDILASIESGRGPAKDIEVKTLLQDIVVLATGLKITNNIPRLLEKSPFAQDVFFKNLSGDISFSTITIEVSPQEAQNLVYIMTTAPGSIFFSLRNPNDRLVNQLGTSNSGTIIGRSTASFLQNINPTPVISPALQEQPRPVQRSNIPRRRGPFTEVK